MALTEQQEAGVLALLAAVSSADMTGNDVASTLRIGKLTTQIASFDAQIENAVKARDDATNAANAAIASLRDRQDAVRAELRTIIGAAQS